MNQDRIEMLKQINSRIKTGKDGVVGTDEHEISADEARNLGVRMEHFSVENGNGIEDEENTI